jgi:hypothetical protein
LVPLSHQGLHSHRALDRIHNRWKLKQHPIPGALHETSAVFRYECIGNLAVFTQCVGGAHLVETHEARVTGDISCDYGSEPASDTI